MGGLRSGWAIVAAPLAAAPAAWAVGRVAAGQVRLPTFTRRDLAAVSLVLLLVPLVVARPFSRVGAMLPEGKAYRLFHG
ncbi:MAG: hypothetical protein R2708_24030 [Vicinamibacterales bacterium]